MRASASAQSRKHILDSRIAFVPSEFIETAWLDRSPGDYYTWLRVYAKRESIRLGAWAEFQVSPNASEDPQLWSITVHCLHPVCKSYKLLLSPHTEAGLSWSLQERLTVGGQSLTPGYWSNRAIKMFELVSPV
jgi:hypothetical protein